ncbi:MAG: hypothetical protein JRN29_02100 [Nitrososphaerota archaeon]|nr:hypothetical protein [Nitrososphaerota archaeon]
MEVPELESISDVAYAHTDARSDGMVSCATCRITRRFLTKQGANRFAMEHSDHDVVEGPLPDDSKPYSIPQAENEMRQAPDKAVPLQKLAIDLVPLEGSRTSLIQITGIAHSGIAFVMDFPSERVKEVMKFITSGRYDKMDTGETERFTWLEGDVEISQEAMKYIPPVTKEVAPQTEVVPKEAVPPRVEEVVEGPRPAVARPQQKTMVGGEDKALAEVLESYRWNKEAPYRVGVREDGILSIETGSGVISGSLIEKVQKLGYTFTAINVQNGVPIAWFKKGQAADPLA